MFSLGGLYHKNHKVGTILGLLDELIHSDSQNAIL